MSSNRGSTPFDDTLEVGLAQPEDIETIAEFNCAMARETEGKRLDPRTVTAGVRAVFETPGRGFYATARADGSLVGCLMITYEWSDWRNAVFWWIQSVYVHPDYRRRGVYRRLYAELKRRADEQGGVCGFRLYVERDNRAAQQTYRDLGMTHAPYRVFETVDTP